KRIPVFGPHDVLVPDRVGEGPAVSHVQRAAATEGSTSAHLEIDYIGSSYLVTNSGGGDPDGLVTAQYVPPCQFDDWREPYAIAIEEHIARTDTVEQNVSRKLGRIRVSSRSHSARSSNRMPKRELRFHTEARSH